ncbi:phosphotransferase family protein [Rhizorhapis suberifaciens]|uniref:Aminoglycoside phosphotransferase (APT) family kinase protein n=1 Tax=Rhizorhapis suberifaciens TaxID=13656 RepID=A0A840HZ02_9SPHN|nr:phosphotransferase family protein [Rhizorhapis suberifaciens]MBB4642817.1 aminoglycoside phosphotransferase (APT) family kinase protein [Rhizorhapis suberifaciens]
MNLDNRRLFQAMAESMNRIALRYDVPASDMDHMAAMTVASELLRRDQADRARDIYAEGYLLAVRLAKLAGEDEASAPLIAQLNGLPATSGNHDGDAPSHDLLDTLKRLLSSLVSKSGYPCDPSGELGAVMASLYQWECELLKLPAPQTAAAQTRNVKEMLESSARIRVPELDGARVVEFTSLVGGFANETTLFKLEDGKGRIWDLVSRGATGLQLGIDGRDLGGEYHLLRYLHAHGIQVAEPIWHEGDVERYGTQFLVTRKIEGKNFGTVVHAQRLSASQLRALAIHLAKIHSLPLDPANPDLQQSHIDTGLIGVSTSEGVGDYLERWIRLWRSTRLENSPSIEATLHWLRANLPQNEEAQVLVHGDYALHNIMMQDDEISGILDWEMSHLGDRAEDLAGLLASFPDEEDAETFMQYYIEAGGKPVTAFQREYCNVFRYFGMYVVMLESEFRFFSLPEVHPELLVLGSFVQTPASRMAQAIEKAERAKALG